MIKKLIFCFLCLFTIFSITNKVSAKELTDFCDYTNPCLTTEQVDSWLIDLNESTGREYDSYIFSIVIKDTTKYYNFVFYNYSNYENGSINFYLDSDNFYKFHIDTYRYKHLYSGSGSVKYKIPTNNMSFTTDSSSKDLIIAYNNSTVQVDAYYSNRDIIDKNGNLILKANIGTEIEEDEEPITIINKMALFVNDIVIYFNENNISFYQILIGLFIFNFLVYVICYIIRKF